MKIGIIGAGPMGSAMVYAFKDHEVMLCDRHPEKLKKLIVSTSNLFSEPDALIPFVDAVLFAVKPQSFEALMGSITTNLNDRLILSVMAGITTTQLRTQTQAQQVIRCMPNLGVQLKTGVTAWFATEAVTEVQRAFIAESLSAVGIQVELKKESLLDAVTAISGSGPAYFFLLAEALTMAAEAMGLTPEQARKIAEGTLVTSGHLMASQKRSAGDWKREIMVSGGTTEAAILSFKHSHFNQMVAKAARAALQRSQELRI
ncbi:Pyrroline-5-carboxylate reductase [Chlamydiales bacterium SCGC AG-110-P3]|nr:Pyrroline-5-carboxylate reductase [Chlamydiales bacterium SCGC AG-110-P3]